MKSKFILTVMTPQKDTEDLHLICGATENNEDCPDDCWCDRRLSCRSVA